MRRLSLSALVCMILIGCGPKKRTNVARPERPVHSAGNAAPARSTPDTLGQLAVEQPSSHRPGSLRPYTVSSSLKEVANLAAFERILKLTDAQRTMLARQLFAASPTDYRQLFWVYENNDYHNLPSFVTTDVALHLYHCFFDYALRTIEGAKLVPLLNELTSECLKASIAQWREAQSNDVKTAALKTVAYFGVASRLLNRTDAVPGPAQALMRTELALVSRHAGYANGSLLPYKIDYSQFVPRGHYTRSPALKRYFMTMMWYGLTPFATRFGDNSPSRASALQGLLMARAMDQAGMLLTWGNIYEPTTFFVGNADDHIPAQWLGVAETVFGRGIRLAGLGDANRLSAFISRVEALPGPSISAKTLSGAGMPWPAHQLRLMGQRAIPDSAVLQALSEPLKRPFPAGLDVMATLGSSRATQLLDTYPDQYNPNNWSGYRPARDQLVREYRSIPDRRWTSTLYWNWLYALQPLLDRLPEGYPSFMTNEGWRDKTLQTALASWTELRHDTILYGKQSSVECGGDEEGPPPTGYVEPNVPLYDRLLNLVLRTRSVVSKNDLMTDELDNGFTEFASLLKFLKRCSEKELKGEKLSEDDNREIRYIGGKIEYLTRTTIEGQPQYWELVDKGDQDMAVVADVHTATPRVLQEGVGRAIEIVVIVPIGGKLVLTRGAMMSYHEFQQPMDDRLTDEAWRAMLDSGKAPKAPFWTRSFLLPAGPRNPKDDRTKSYSSGC